MLEPVATIQLVVALAIAAGALALPRARRYLGAPLLLVVGLAMGPGVLNVFTDDALVSNLNQWSLGVLLFFLALNTRPSAIAQGGRLALPLAAYDLVLSFAAAYWIGDVLHWGLLERLLLAGVLATNSTSAVLNTLHAEGRLHEREGNVLVALLWIEDVVFIAYFLVLNATQTHAAFFTPSHGAHLGLFIASIIAMRRMRSYVWGQPSRTLRLGMLVTAALAAGFFGAGAGLPHMGATFTAGLVLASRSSRMQLQRDAPWIQPYASALFFLAFGATLTPQAAMLAAPAAALATLALIVVKFGFLAPTSRWLGLTGPESRVLGASLTARGGKSASYTHLNHDAAQTTLPGIAGLMAAITTPLAPLVVRWLLGKKKAHIEADSHEAWSRMHRRLLAPHPFQQRNPSSWLERIVLVQTYVLALALAAFSAVASGYVAAAGAALTLAALFGAHRTASSYFARAPGVGRRRHSTYAHPWNRGERVLPWLLTTPILLGAGLLAFENAAFIAYPALAAATFAFLAWRARDGARWPKGPRAVTVHVQS